MPDSILHAPVRLGTLTLPSRIVMAPMARFRADDAGVPTAMMALHYAQRASAGLIVAEMAYVSPEGRAYMNTAGILDDAQVAGWRRVARAVHNRGGRIVLQLAHGGRATHPLILPHGVQPVAPSAVRPSILRVTRDGALPAVEPRALTPDEIARLVDDFAAAARRARDAGFDGVELHAANGYLLDQFLRSGSNRRTDAYGGRAAGRARFLDEVVEAVAHAWEPGRVGVRISPFNAYNDMHDDEPAATFGHVARRLAGRRLAYLHVVEPVDAAPRELRLTPLLRRLFRGAVVANGGFDAPSAADAIERGEADAVSFGLPFVANPDLPRRLRLGVPLAAPDVDVYAWAPGETRGYTDYPPHDSAA